MKIPSVSDYSYFLVPEIFFGEIPALSRKFNNDFCESYSYHVEGSQGRYLDQ